MHRTPFFLVALLIFFQSWGAVEVIFPDVGQGNSALVLSKDPAVPLLLVDCGSLGFAFKGDDYKAKQINAIIAILTDPAKTKTNSCIIVVSHPDEDHYNWIKPVINGCKKTNKLFRVTSIFLGGTLDWYSSEFKKFVTELKDAPSSPATVTYPTEASATTTILSLFTKNGTKPSYTILPALQCTKEAEKNDASLVVRVEYDNEVCLLTGDATKKTTDHILAHFPSPKAKILQASHHGASDEGCNEETWVNAVKPDCIIISSGLKHMHPREEVIETFLAALPAEPAATPHHVVAYGTTRDDASRILQPCTLYDRGYAILSTPKKLIGTLRHGTIFLTLEPGKPLSIPSNALIPGDSLEKSMSSLEGSLSKSPEVFSIQNIREICLAGLAVSDGTPREKDALITLLKALHTSKSPTLRALLFDDTRLSQQDTVDVLKALIENNKAISRTILLESALPPLPVGKAKQDIIAAWDNRGLTFK